MSTTERLQDRSDRRKRQIHAASQAVFAAIQDPDRLARWWGPDGFTSTFDVFDFVAGGRWQFVMHGPDGRDYRNESVFLEIARNERVVIEHLSGHHFILTVTLTPNGDGTEVGWAQAFDTVEHFRQVQGFVSAANEQNLSRLEAEVMSDRRDG